nr:MAG TPA: hypothetical protein [Caudoviricetes sp.]
MIYFCDYALRSDYSCYIAYTQKVTPLLRQSKALLFSSYLCQLVFA